MWNCHGSVGDKEEEDKEEEEEEDQDEASTVEITNKREDQVTNECDIFSFFLKRNDNLVV